jgi:hypothetical protein
MGLDQQVETTSNPLRQGILFLFHFIYFFLSQIINKFNCN